MASSRPRRFRFPRLAAPLVAISAFVLIAGTARASCLHPAGVTWANDSNRATTTFEIFRIDDDPTNDPAGPGHRSPLPGRPCSGPHCQEQSAPTQAPVHVAPVEADHGCLMAAWSVRPPRESTTFDGAEPLTALTRLHSAPERPPRGR